VAVCHQTDEWAKSAGRETGTILEAVRLAPSSLGLQPYTVFVVESEAWRKKVSPAIYNQPQILEGSHVLVFCGLGEHYPESIDNYLDNVAKARNIPASSWKGTAA
jgi:nitroreductase